MALIIDDGVPRRGYRRHIFDPAFRGVGVAVVSTLSMNQCVCTFAGRYIERTQGQ